MAAVIRLERFPEEQIAVVTLDRPPLNAIDEQVVTELAGAIGELAAELETRAVLVRSAVEGVFMAGADIHEFERIADEGVERALLGLPEVRLGLRPGAGGTQRLTRLVGPGRATELIMKGLQLTPDQAAGAGLVHFLVEPGELEDRVRDYTVRLARQAPIALRGIKRAIRAAVSPDGLAVERDAFREVLQSGDAQTGVKAFLEGDKPSFSGH